MTIRKLYDCLYKAARLTASVLFIIATAGAMQWVLVALQIPQNLASFCLQYIDSKFAFLIFVLFGAVHTAPFFLYLSFHDLYKISL